MIDYLHLMMDKEMYRELMRYLMMIHQIEMTMNLNVELFQHDVRVLDYQMTSMKNELAR